MELQGIPLQTMPMFHIRHSQVQALPATVETARTAQAAPIQGKERSPSFAWCDVSELPWAEGVAKMQVVHNL
jgi:hypothetical protein